jgi:hypothetical protein
VFGAYLDVFDEFSSFVRAPTLAVILNRPQVIISPTLNLSSNTSKCAMNLRTRLADSHIVAEVVLELLLSSLDDHAIIGALRHGKICSRFDQLLTSSSSAPPSSTTLLNPTPALPLLNGHGSPLASSTLTNDDAPYDSESDLSEVANPIVDEPSPAPSTHHRSEFGAQDTDDPESSAAEAQDESDDADFDMEDSPPPAAPSRGRQDRSTSAESRRPAKRKADHPLEDEHILANPELYGLRRSVCYCRWCACRVTLLTISAGPSSPTPNHRSSIQAPIPLLQIILT